MPSIPPDAPAPPWPFAAELAAPLWDHHGWATRGPAGTEADLRAGWTLRDEVADAALDTAWEDLDDFALAGGVPGAGPYRLVVRLAPGMEAEEHRIVTAPDETVLLAGGVEGIRRAVFRLQDRMLAAGGAFLPLGETHHSPVITTRISRCFFGPINRPPANRDELSDDVDYYPPQYLNRLAHESVNGIWLTVRLRDLYPQEWSGTPDVDPEVRLSKLRRTVEACARYGIRVYLFCIDPAAFGDGAEYLIPSEALDGHPEFAGHRDARWTTFCTRGAEGRAYAVDALGHVFGSVQGLGGLVTITIGERPTHCWSLPWSGTPVNCPRCTQGDPADAFADHLRVLREGVSSGSPDAEVISWMYVPVVDDNPHWSVSDVHDLLVDIAERTPEGVTVQVNMESTGTTEQFGRSFDVFDYSLAWVGPSAAFERVAAAVGATGGRMGAKLQVGCSHEVATVPYVPAPGNLYRKYRALHAQGVSSVMQSWYFGNAPGPMTKAAGLLSFAPLPATEDEFLTELAAPGWGPDAGTMVAAWQEFRDAYSRFPATLPFSWFGPVHDGAVWPWHLDPVDLPISPSWELGWPASGDRVGEVFAPAFSFAEITDVVDGIAAQWRRGFDLIAPLRARYADDRPRLLDLGVAEALALQWESAARVLRWYRLREQLARSAPEQRTGLIDELATLIDEQLPALDRLAELAADDSRLGFHSEAEGHKYTPGMLGAQAQALRAIRDRGLPDLRARARRTAPLWPGWDRPADEEPSPPRLGTTSADAPWTPLGDGRWRSWATADALHFEAELPDRGTDDEVTIEIEAARLWPVLPFRVHREGWALSERTLLPSAARWSAESTMHDGGWTARAAWPLEIFRAPGMRDGFRMSVTRSAAGERSRWPATSPQPLRARLCFGDRDPEALGWVTPPPHSSQT